MLRKGSHNSLIVPSPRIAQVIVGRLSYLFLIHLSLCRKLAAVFVWRGGNIIGNFAFNLVIIQMKLKQIINGTII